MPWISSATTAVGIAQSATCRGARVKPYVVSTNEVISSTAPTATKMSSPKKAPTLSVLAAKARMRWTTRSGSTPYLRTAAASAMGATSGRTVCACPPMLISPMAARTWRRRR